MKGILKSILIVTLTLSVTAATFAAKLETPRERTPHHGFITMTSPETTAGLAAGNPGGFAMGSSWVTSDYSVSEFETYPFWCTFEFIDVWGLFYTTKEKNTTATATIKNQAGNTVFTQSFTGVPEPNEIQGLAFPVGTLPEGPYKVIFKFKQGDKIIGSTYWIAVYTCKQ